MLWVAGATALVAQSIAKMPREDVVKAVLTDPKLTAALPADGRPVFEKVCATCHKFGSLGKEVGPDLTSLASRVKKPEALESILWPSRQIADQYQTTMIEKKDGNVVAGMLLREDAARVVVVSPPALDAPITVLKSQIKARQKSSTSLMPEDLLNEFSLPQVAALLAFLYSPPR